MGFTRNETRRIYVGKVPVGGGAPVRVPTPMRRGRPCQGARRFCRGLACPTPAVARSLAAALKHAALGPVRARPGRGQCPWRLKRTAYPARAQCGHRLRYWMVGGQAWL